VVILSNLSLILLMASCLDTPLMADLTECFTLRLTPLLSHDVFECAGDKKMEESIFVDEGLQGIDG
jgi:hypothetical protein